MSAASGRDVAVVGASSLIGEAVIAEIRRSGLPVGRIHRLEELRDIGRGGADEEAESTPAMDAGSFDFSRVRLAFFCCRASLARSLAPAAGHCLVIDGSGAFRDAAEVPLVLADVNAAALVLPRPAAGPVTGLVAVPGSAVAALAMAVAPLHGVAGVRRLDLATYHSVSGGGRAAVEELARETAALLNGQEPRARAGAARQAFNVVPQVDQFTDSGQTQEEIRLQSELIRLLDRPNLAVNATAVRVPVFFGHGMAVHAQFEREISPEQARAAWQKSTGIGLADANAARPYATPADRDLDGTLVHIGRLRRDVTRPASLNFWVVADNVRKCAAINAVSVAHILVNRYC